jgi:predicted DNA-binding transcriptional regulator YafY
MQQTRTEDTEDTGSNSCKVILLVRLLNAIDKGAYSFEQLKEHIAEGKPLSTRSMRRYLETLGKAGLPWYFDRDSRTYRFPEGYSLQRLNLSSNEIIGLLTINEMAPALGPTFARYIDQATKKLIESSDTRTTTAIENQSVAVRFDAVAIDTNTERTFELLQKAEKSRRQAQFAYTDKNGNRTTRRVDAYGFIVSNGRIYLVSYDHTRNDIRVFAVDNIDQVDLCPTTFTRPVEFNINDYGAKSISGVWETQSVTSVTVRFSRVVAKAAAASNVSQRTDMKINPDGSMEITYEVSDISEIVRWSMTWGPEARIIEPKEARIQAREMASRIAESYACEMQRPK